MFDRSENNERCRATKTQNLLSAFFPDHNDARELAVFFSSPAVKSICLYEETGCTLLIHSGGACFLFHENNLSLVIVEFTVECVRRFCFIYGSLVKIGIVVED